MLIKRGMAFGAAIALCAACGPNNGTGNNNNMSTNNTSTNNTSTNNTSMNNTSTNNTSTNNTSTNNSNTNNTNNNTMVDMRTCFRSELDSDGNGSIDSDNISYYTDDPELAHEILVQRMSSPFQSNTYRIYNEYDADGNLTKQEVDFGDDGSSDWVFTLTWDADGNQTSLGLDNDNDGTDEYTSDITYDEFGQITSVSDDGVMGENFDITEEADGTPTNVLTLVWRAEGQLESQTIDLGNDGTDDMTAVWTFDGDDNPTEFSQDGFTNGDDWRVLLETADGTADLRVVQVFDVDGNMTAHREDGYVILDENNDISVFEPQDGTFDFVEFDITYDSDGNRSGWRQDGVKNGAGLIAEEANGSFDAYRNVTWQQIANETDVWRVASGELDKGEDNSVDFARTWTWDDDGQLLTSTRDGVQDYWTGAILTTADGTFQDTLEFTYFDVDKISSYARDFDNDGADDATIDATWNTDGNLTLWESDGSLPPEGNVFGDWGEADGTVDYRDTRTYDSEGRLLTIVQEETDGTNLQTTLELTRTWDLCSVFEENL